jgi:hypothetical protein
MSARRQGGQLRAILVRKLRSSGLNEAMVDILQKNNQVYTGTLSQSILKRDLAKNLSISYKINKDIDIIENVVVRFVNKVSEPSYAGRVEKTLGAVKDENTNVIARAIESWIFEKVRNGTWKNVNGANYKKSNSRGSTYFYPLSSNKKARASLAFVIARSINRKQILKNRSPFLINPKINLRAEFAILSGLEEFNELWLQDLGVESINKVISIFQ